MENIGGMSGKSREVEPERYGVKEGVVNRERTSTHRSQPTGVPKLLWDFRDCHSDELGGCFLYEFARESRTILGLASVPARETRGVRPAAWCSLFEINGTCAGILWNLRLDNPNFDLGRSSWFDLSKQQREMSALMVRESPSFWDFPTSHALFGEGRPVGPSENGHQLVPVMIDWSVGLDKIIKDASTWLKRHRPEGAPLRHRGKGRHATCDSFWRDALRKLGALRLLSKYPLKTAIEVSKGYQKKRSGESESIYCGFIDESGRPTGQTAWDNAIKGVLKIFREIFHLQEQPISYEKYQFRRGGRCPAK